MSKVSPSSASPLSAQGHSRAEKLYSSGPLVEPRIRFMNALDELVEIDQNNPNHHKKGDEIAFVKGCLDIVSRQIREHLDSTGEEKRSEAPALASLRSTGGTDKGDI